MQGISFLSNLPGRVNQRRRAVASSRKNCVVIGVCSPSQARSEKMEEERMSDTQVIPKITRKSSQSSRRVSSKTGKVDSIQSPLPLFQNQLESPMCKYRKADGGNEGKNTLITPQGGNYYRDSAYNNVVNCEDGNDKISVNGVEIDHTVGNPDGALFPDIFAAEAPSIALLAKGDATRQFQKGIRSVGIDEIAEKSEIYDEEAVAQERHPTVVKKSETALKREQREEALKSLGNQLIEEGRVIHEFKKRFWRINRTLLIRVIVHTSKGAVVLRAYVARSEVRHNSDISGDGTNPGRINDSEELCTIIMCLRTIMMQIDGGQGASVNDEKASAIASFVISRIEAEKDSTGIRVRVVKRPADPFESLDFPVFWGDNKSPS